MGEQESKSLEMAVPKSCHQRCVFVPVIVGRTKICVRLEERLSNERETCFRSQVQCCSSTAVLAINFYDNVWP